MLGSLPGGCEVNFRWLVTVTSTSALEETGERSLCFYPISCVSPRPIPYEPTRVGWGESILQEKEIPDGVILCENKSGVPRWRSSPKLISVIELSLSRLSKIVVSRRISSILMATSPRLGMHLSEDNSSWISHYC